MSTKSTLKCQWSDSGHEGFHLYEECLDGANAPVYLELNGCHFTATSSMNSGLPNIVLTIPRGMAKDLGLVE